MANETETSTVTGIDTPAILHGRQEILTAVDTIDRSNLLRVLGDSIAVHTVNASAVSYLWDYYRGIQPILQRVKEIRPEICNKIVENHANEIVQFTSGYFLGEPITYIRRGDREGASRWIDELNSYMFFEDKASHDKSLATWMAICGVAYRMILPDKRWIQTGVALPEDESPFEIDTLDPRTAFVVYHSGFGHRRMMGVQIVTRETSPGTVEIRYCGYTPTHYFEVVNGTIEKWERHLLPDIPIFEYDLNIARMGAFEPALPLLDALNVLASNRVDGVEQFVQSFLKFVNCEIEPETVEKLKSLGAVAIKSWNGNPADVSMVSSELNQQQTQTLVDYIYDQILVICGMPTTKKGGTSTSDTGSAVLLRDGWQQAEARARDSEMLFKKSEKEFLKSALGIIREKVLDFDLSLAEVEYKFTRRQHDNLQSKTQALTGMLQAGLSPEVAIATCGLFNDPMDVCTQSAEYLAKWKPVPMSGNENLNDYGNTDAEDEV